MFSKAKKLFSFVAIISVVLLSASCKKETAVDNGNPPAPVQKTSLVSGVYVNDALEVRYYYGANKKVSKAEWLYGTGAVSDVDMYEYAGDGTLSKIIRADDVAGVTWYEFSADANGRILSAKVTGTAGVVPKTITYAYDPVHLNRVIKKTEKTDDSPGQKTWEYSYQNDMLSAVKEYYQPLVAGIKTLKERWSFEPVTNPVLQEMYKTQYRAFAEPDPDYWLSEMAGANYTRKVYKNDGAINTYSYKKASDKIFNPAGYISTQKITNQFIIPAAADIIHNIRYEYTEL
jgi:hypothetical protein